MFNASMDHADATSKWKTEFLSTTKTIFAQKLNTEYSNCGTACMNSTVFNAIDKDMNITGEINPDVKQEWQPLGILLGEKVTVNPAHTTVSTVGRMKYLSPIYNALVTTTEKVQLDSGPADGKQVAQDWYQENYSFYSPYA